MHNTSMNRLGVKQQVQMLSALVEGNSIRATSRMTGVAFNTVLKFVVDAGEACASYQDETLRNLTCKRLQADEIWSFIGTKRQDIWTWTAICADTKLVPSWYVGPRNAASAYRFLSDLASRLSHRIQLTTDGHRAYMEAVEDVFGDGIDYAMLVKLYGREPEGQRRYSPGACIGARPVVIHGKPDEASISTSYAERQNLTMRMGMRRFTRLTNGFSRKVANLEAAVALHFMHYNFVRIHQSLRVTPAMAAGIAKRPWELDGIVSLIEQRVYLAK